MHKTHMQNSLFTKQSWPLMTMRKEVFENILGKGENAGDQHFLLFLKMFSTIPEKFQFFSRINVIPCKCFEIRSGLKFCR